MSKFLLVTVINLGGQNESRYVNVDDIQSIESFNAPQPNEALITLKSGGSLHVQENANALMRKCGEYLHVHFLDGKSVILKRSEIVFWHDRTLLDLPEGEEQPIGTEVHLSNGEIIIILETLFGYMDLIN